MNRRALLLATGAAVMARPVRAAGKHLLVAGQSLASAWAKHPAAFDAFLEARCEMGDLSSWDLTVAAEGASALLKEHATPQYPDRYWWDRDQWLAGPSLTRSLAKIHGLQFTHAVWIQGQTDAKRWDGADYDAVTLKRRYKEAYIQVEQRLFPGGKLHLNVLEFRAQPEAGDIHIREAHRELIASGRALQGAEPNPGMVKMADGVHPSPVAGCADMGARVARAIEA